MRIVRYHEFGGPEVLRVEETDPPEPGPGQVRVRVEAVGANFVHTLARRGRPLPWSRPLPSGVGGDVVGAVDALGDGVTGVAVGDRVAGLADPGFADEVVMDVDRLVRVPAGLDAAQASILPMDAIVALGALEMGRLTRGESVLVHAAAGGIGHLAVQAARLRGAGTVIGTAGSPAKLDFVRAQGADAAVDYGADDWPDQVREAAPGGVDVILDSVGGEITARGADLLAPYGRLVGYGMAGGAPDVPGMPLIFGHRYATGFSMLALREHRPEEAERLAAEALGLVVGGALRTAVHATLPLAEAAEAHRILEAREQLGRILLTA